MDYLNKNEIVLDYYYDRINFGNNHLNHLIVNLK